MKDLAWEACDAAIAIDNHILGRATLEEYQNVQDLASSLGEISREGDFSYLVKMARALWPNKNDWRGKVIEDVRSQTSSLSEDLAIFTKLPEERQEYLRAVCVRVSYSVMNLPRYLGLVPSK